MATDASIEEPVDFGRRSNGVITVQIKSHGVCCATARKGNAGRVEKRKLDRLSAFHNGVVGGRNRQRGRYTTVDYVPAARLEGTINSPPSLLSDPPPAILAIPVKYLALMIRRANAIESPVISRPEAVAG